MSGSTPLLFYLVRYCACVCHHYIFKGWIALVVQIESENFRDSILLNINIS